MRSPSIPLPGVNLPPPTLHHGSSFPNTSQHHHYPPLLTSIAPPSHPQTPPQWAIPSTDRGYPNPSLLSCLKSLSLYWFFLAGFGGSWKQNGSKNGREEEEGGRAGRAGERRLDIQHLSARALPKGAFGTLPAESGGPCLPTRQTACTSARALPTDLFGTVRTESLLFRQHK